VPDGNISLSEKRRETVMATGMGIALIVFSPVAFCPVALTRYLRTRRSDWQSETEGKD